VLLTAGAIALAILLVRLLSHLWQTGLSQSGLFQ